MINRLKKATLEKNRAFTLFVAILVASMVLAIGFSIGNIVIKQLLLTASGANTQVSFYVADSAAECALYWDRKDGDGITIDLSPFATSTPSDLRIVCGTGTFTDGGGLVYGFNKMCNDGTCGPSATVATTTFFIDFRDPLDANYRGCGFVTVGKTFDASTGAEFTTIDARGYNTDLIVEDAGTGYGNGGTAANVRCNLDRPRVVERGLRLNY